MNPSCPAGRPFRNAARIPEEDSRVARSGCRHAGRHGTAMIGSCRAWAAGRPPVTARWHLASGLPLAAALVRFGALTGRGTATAGARSADPRRPHGGLRAGLASPVHGWALGNAVMTTTAEAGAGRLGPVGAVARPGDRAAGPAPARRPHRGRPGRRRAGPRARPQLRRRGPERRRGSAATRDDQLDRARPGARRSGGQRVGHLH